MTNTCKTCKHWRKYREAPRGAMQATFGWGACENPRFTDNATGSDLIRRDWGNRAFATGPDFGCIHHEEKA